jgi:hypothetical protein
MSDISTNKGAGRKSPIKDNAANKKGVAIKLPSGDARSYATLRVALDSFQAVALAYYAAGTSAGEREKRVGQIRAAVKKSVKKWHPKSSRGKSAPAKKMTAKGAASKVVTLREELLVDPSYTNGCGPGYCDCNGFCIPQGQPCF